MPAGLKEFLVHLYKHYSQCLSIFKLFIDVREKGQEEIDLSFIYFYIDNYLLFLLFCIKKNRYLCPLKVKMLLLSLKLVFFKHNLNLFFIFCQNCRSYIDILNG